MVEPHDPAFLWDMLDAARSVQQFTAGTSLEQYLGNRMMQLALVKNRKWKSGNESLSDAASLEGTRLRIFTNTARRYFNRCQKIPPSPSERIS